MAFNGSLGSFVGNSGPERKAEKHPSAKAVKSARNGNTISKEICPSGAGESMLLYRSERYRNLLIRNETTKKRNQSVDLLADAKALRELVSKIGNGDRKSTSKRTRQKIMQVATNHGLDDDLIADACEVRASSIRLWSEGQGASKFVEITILFVIAELIGELARSAASDKEARARS